MAGNDEASPVVVCDAGPLIHLDELGCLELLADFPRVLIPEAVWVEVGRHRPAVLVCQGIRLERQQQTDPRSAELDALVRLLMLHYGETEALQLAQGMPHCVLLTDDTAARLAARHLRLPVHGTIGIIVRAIRRKQKTKDEVLALLRSLPRASTLHLRPSLLEEVLRKVEESS